MNYEEMSNKELRKEVEAMNRVIYERMRSMESERLSSELEKQKEYDGCVMIEYNRGLKNEVRYWYVFDPEINRQQIMFKSRTLVLSESGDVTYRIAPHPESFCFETMTKHPEPEKILAAMNRFEQYHNELKGGLDLI